MAVTINGTTGIVSAQIDETATSYIEGVVGGSTAQIGSASDASSTLRLKDDDGNFDISTVAGTFRIYDDGLERLRIDSSGGLQALGGVYLGGTGAANYLDDYETGSWTPTIEGASSNPSISYGTRNGRYIKIGDLVYATFFVKANTINSQGSGAALLSGFPFTITNEGSSNETPAVFYYFHLLGKSGVNVLTTRETGSTKIVFNNLDGSGVPSTLDCATLQPQYLVGSYTYRTA